MHAMLRISLVITLLFCGHVLCAQEPATIDSAPAVRFEQSPGYFHYAAFCRTPKEFSAQIPKSGLPLDKIEFGISWYVRASVVRPAGAAPEVDGRIVISPHHVRFMPADAQFAAQYVDLPRGEVELNRSPGQPDASLRSKDITVNFKFRKICSSCAPDTPVPAGLNAARLEQEFALLDDTITHFESGWRTTYRLSKGVPVEAASGNLSASTASTTSRATRAPKTTTASNADVSSGERFVPSEAGISSPAAANAATVPNRSADALASSGPVVPGTPKGRTVKISSGAASGRLVKQVQPSYPLEAKLVRLEGTVILHAIIDRTGEMSEVYALSGPPLLESAAVDAVKQWQYRPYVVNGKPMDVETTIEVTFALDGSHPLAKSRK